MTRSFLDIPLISSAMTAGDGLMPAVGAGRAGDRGSRRSARHPRWLRPLLALLACALVVVSAWALVRGKAALDPGMSATLVAGSDCDSSLCSVTKAPTKMVLPPEWRWEKKGYDFDDMFREAPATSRVAARESSRR